LVNHTLVLQMGEGLICSTDNRGKHPRGNPDRARGTSFARYKRIQTHVYSVSLICRPIPTRINSSTQCIISARAYAVRMLQ